jgi:TPR repeat protein
LHEKRGYRRLVIEGTLAKYEVTDYDTYDSQTLKELANNNDPKAMMALSKRLLHKGELELAKPLLIQASVLGYTKSIVDLGFIYEDQFLRTKNKANILQAIAWYQVAVKRGDITAEAALTLAMRQHSDLNQDDYAEINTLAEDLYSSLAEVRRKTGLEDFDNSTPSALYKL